MFDDLNDRQRQAVLADGAAMIVAGPGTGKTKTLAARIVHLLANSPPRDILALTFTHKAAAEMQTRVAKLLSRGQA
jgi:ATP-dependent DNA helicase UvrD/PcrA